MTQNRISACWRYFSAPKKLAGATLEAYMPRNPEQEKALAVCARYGVDDIRAGRGLLLIGPYGAGKSHLAVATVKRLIAAQPEIFGSRSRALEDEGAIYDPEEKVYQGLCCSFFSLVDLLDALRPGGSEYKQSMGAWMYHRAKTDALIVLDDVGAQRATEWTEEKIYSLIDARYRMERATILTTNCSQVRLEASCGERSVSRLYEMTTPVQVLGPDYRKTAR